MQKIGKETGQHHSSSIYNKTNISLSSFLTPLICRIPLFSPLSGLLTTRRHCIKPKPRNTLARERFGGRSYLAVYNIH